MQLNAILSQLAGQSSWLDDVDDDDGHRIS